MKSKLHFVLIISIIFMFGLLSAVKTNAQCTFVGLDSDGNRVFDESICCCFPILMGNTATDSMNYMQNMNQWYSLYPHEVDFPNHYISIGWFEFIGQTQERQDAIKRQPDLYHVLRLDYQNSN